MIQSHSLFYKVTLGLEETTYTVNERETSVTVCIDLVSGTLDRVVHLHVLTGDVEATDGGMYME